MRGTALMEFALAWPVALLLVLGAVETAVWGSEVYAARSAALAGARAGAVVGAGSVIAARVALHTLAPSLVGVAAAVWCPSDLRKAPPVWVCAREVGAAIEVVIGGAVPALVPILSEGGLPLNAHVLVQKEAFVR